MSARDQQSLRRRDVGFVEIAFVDRHVGAIVAVEHQWKRIPVFDAEQDQRRQAARIDAHATRVAALAFEGFEQKAPHVIVSDARQHGRLEAQPRAAKRDVCRRPAQIFREARHVLEPRADLLRVEVDREPSQANDVPRSPRGEARSRGRMRLLCRSRSFGHRFSCGAAETGPISCALRQLPRFGAARHHIEHLVLGDRRLRESAQRASAIEQRERVADRISMLNIMRDENHRNAFLAHPMDQPQYVGALLDAQRRRWFVENQHPRPEVNCARDGERLPFTARHRAHGLVWVAQPDAHLSELVARHARAGVEVHHLDEAQPPFLRFATQKEIARNREQRNER